MKTVIKCSRCRFWDEGENNRGWCRRHAPGHATWEGSPPRTHAHDWCGEAEAREGLEGERHE